MRPLAQCFSCHTIFSSNMFEITNGVLDTSSGFVSVNETCPKCGGLGNILPGIHRSFGNVIEFFTETPGTIDDLHKLSDIFKNAKSEGSSPEEVAVRIDEEVPLFNGLKKFLTNNRDGIIIGIILTILNLLLSEMVNSLKAEEPSRTKNPCIVEQSPKIEDKRTIINIKNVIQNITEDKVVEQMNEDSGSLSVSNKREKVTEPILRDGPKTGRNDPCPCGSEKKYKKCCGKN